MKRNIILTSMLLGAVIFSPSAFAAQTPPQRLRAPLPEINMIQTNGGVINANIDDTTGALSADFTPRFIIITNKDGGSKELTQYWECNTSGGTQNAVYNVGSVPFVILTNNDVMPPLSSVANIKTGAPTAANNPNAIAYSINDPPNIIGVLQTEFSPVDNNWKLHLSKQGITLTSQKIPGLPPVANTFSGDDEAGRYQATVTLSFNP